MHYHQKRFEYNINPGTAEKDQQYRYRPTRQPLDASPVPTRKSLNRSYQDIPRMNQSLPYAYEENFNNTNYNPPSNYQKDYRPRPRGNSTHQYQEKTSKIETYDVPSAQAKKTKKVYGGQNFGTEFQDITLKRVQKGKRDQKGRNVGNELRERPLPTSQENVNTSNLARSRGKRAVQPAGQQVQQEILEKIGRINRLNEEINSRLQRMLVKMQSFE